MEAEASSGIEIFRPSDDAYLIPIFSSLFSFEILYQDKKWRDTEKPGFFLREPTPQGLGKKPGFFPHRFETFIGEQSELYRS